MHSTVTTLLESTTSVHTLSTTSVCIGPAVSGSTTSVSSTTSV